MELIEVLQQITQRCIENMALSDLIMGSVTNVSPLEITTEDTRVKLPSSVLRLTASVIAREIPVLAHHHEITGLTHSHTAKEGETASSLTDRYASNTALEEICCYEHKKKLPVENGVIVLNRGLEIGDKVLLWRVSGGQTFVVVSRIFPAG